MLKGKLLDELNEQIKYELYSSQLYLAMAAYCYSIDLDGFAHFFIVQAEEEKFHGMKIFNFINDMDADILIQGMDNPPTEFDSIEHVLENSLEHEKFVTGRIYFLMDIAMEEKEHATISFLKWFIDEQVEEEATFKTLIQKLKRAQGDVSVVYNLDETLSTRTFTPPPQA